MSIINAHVHLFRDEDVSPNFLPLGMVNVCKNNVAWSILGWAMHNLNPFTDSDSIDRYRKFVEISRLGGQKEIFEQVKEFYPSDTKFIVLPMDMAFMGAGKPDREYKEQLLELANLRDVYPNNIIPFIHIDPRRENAFDLFVEMVEKYNFKGIKLYTPLGYFPYDERLYTIYSYAQDKGLPVMSHCSASGPVYFRGSKNQIRDLLTKAKLPVKYVGNEMVMCSNFADPENYKILLRDFPRLKICLAHFGGDDSWEDFTKKPKKDIPNNWFMQICDMLPQFANLFTDLSYIGFIKKFHPMIKVICSEPRYREKILFGSDYYMASVEGSERGFSIDLRATLGEDIFKQISSVNSNIYLNL